MGSRFGVSRTRGSDSNRSSIIRITPLSKEEIKELKSVTRNLSAVKAFYGNPEMRKRMAQRAKAIQTKFNIHQQTERSGPDKWHVLVESSTGKKIKAHCMSRNEARQRNKTILGLGMEWTLGEM